MSNNMTLGTYDHGFVSIMISECWLLSKIISTCLPQSLNASILQYHIAITGFVYDNPLQRFIIATDATITDEATAKAAIFENTMLDGGASGSTTTGISSAKMDVATLDSSNASLPLKIVGILDDVDNEDFAAAGIPMIVMINNHALLQADSEAAIS